MPSAHLDLDLLLMGDQRVDLPRPGLPPRLHLRAFVLLLRCSGLAPRLAGFGAGRTGRLAAATSASVDRKGRIHPPTNAHSVHSSRLGLLPDPWLRPASAAPEIPMLFGKLLLA